MLIDLMKKTRSYRRFLPEPAPTATVLEKLVDLARLAPSSANKQPLKYILSGINRPGQSFLLPKVGWLSAGLARAK